MPTLRSGVQYSGKWTKSQQMQATAAGTWPEPPVIGKLYAWGYNNFGTLGQGNTTNYSSPVQVGALTTWSNVANGYDAVLAPILDGTMWAWGKNADGQNGQGDTSFGRSSPVQVGALTTWASAASGTFFEAAIKTDGTLWTWGRGSDGRTGQNSTTNYSSPVQVGSLTNWSKLAESPHKHTLAIKTDGTLWAWGSNVNGRLGDGTTTTRSSPVQIGALTTWAMVSCGQASSRAIKTDGTLWAWGNNAFGQLGLNNSTYYSSPVQVGALTTWLFVSAGEYHTSAIKTDGTLWSWGFNNFGQLGVGNTTDYSSPVQVGALTTWARVSVGKYFVLATRNDGTLWAWGEGEFGKLGQGSTTNYSSPVQVGALTTWLKPFAGLSSSFCTLK